MSEQAYKIEVREEHFTVREVLVKVFTTPWSWICANVHSGGGGFPIVALPTHNPTRDEWSLLKQAVDEAFAEYEKRWPK